ncbi:MAG: hypothetical protein JHC95_04320 [Solirubrobacteraceae bacterium]|nr:hypothetical protein [Solirubrobacteraceae bacterium]
MLTSLATAAWAACLTAAFALPIGEAGAAVVAHQAERVHDVAVLADGDIAMLETNAVGGVDLRFKARGSTEMRRVALAQRSASALLAPEGPVARLAWLEDGVLRTGDTDGGPVRPTPVRDTTGALAAGRRLTPANGATLQAQGAAFPLREVAGSWS